MTLYLCFEGRVLWTLLKNTILWRFSYGILHKEKDSLHNQTTTAISTPDNPRPQELHNIHCITHNPYIFLMFPKCLLQVFPSESHGELLNEFGS